MLEGLDQIDWKSLHHAYGEAANVPKAIRALGSYRRDVREKACEQLSQSIYHQGTVYEVTASAVPFLIELLREPDTPDKALVLGLLELIGSGTSYLEVHARDNNSAWAKNVRAEPDFESRLTRERSWVVASHAAVANGIPTYRDLLLDEAEMVRGGAAYLLGRFQAKAETIAPMLVSALRREQNGLAKAFIALSLGRLGAPQGIAELSEMIEAAGTPLPRWSAAVALTKLLGRNTPQGVVDALADSVANSTAIDEELQELPWFVVGATEAVDVLPTLGPDRAIPILTTLLDAERRAVLSAAISSLLDIRFPGWRDRRETQRDWDTPGPLSGGQHETLLAIASRKRAWLRFTTDYPLHKRLGLPGEREAVLARLGA
jgi:hypothetical protein